MHFSRCSICRYFSDFKTIGHHQTTKKRLQDLLVTNMLIRIGGDCRRICSLSHTHLIWKHLCQFPKGAMTNYEKKKKKNLVAWNHWLSWFWRLGVWNGGFSGSAEAAPPHASFLASGGSVPTLHPLACRNITLPSAPTLTWPCPLPAFPWFKSPSVFLLHGHLSLDFRPA